MKQALRIMKLKWMRELKERADRDESWETAEKQLRDSWETAVRQLLDSCEDSLKIWARMMKIDSSRQAWTEQMDRWTN